MQEEWKSLNGIVECGNYYEISNLGRVRSIDRKIIRNDGKVKHFKSKILNQRIAKNGYYMVTLSFDGKTKPICVHRLVTLAFVGGHNETNNYVNHLDENKLNNNCDNLEWTTLLGNLLYGTTKERIKESCNKNGVYERNSVKILKINPKTDEIIEEYKSITDAVNDTGIDGSSISKVARNKRKTAGGYKWKYKEGEEN